MELAWVYIRHGVMCNSNSNSNDYFFFTVIVTVMVVCCNIEVAAFQGKIFI